MTFKKKKKKERESINQSADDLIKLGPRLHCNLKGRIIASYSYE